MSQRANDREFIRTAPALAAEIHVGDETLPGQVVNVSLNGVLVSGVGDLAVGTACRVVVLLSSEDPSLQIEAAGTVVRTDPAGAAVQFTELHGVASYWHLRNLILYNAADPAKAEAEFEAHHGLRKRPD